MNAILSRTTCSACQPSFTDFSNVASDTIDTTDRNSSCKVVESRPAVIVSDDIGDDYCILLSLNGDRVRAIRDYRYARHVLPEGSSRTV